MTSGMQKSKIHILSTRPAGKKLIDEAAKIDIIIDEISFIKTEEITDNDILNKTKELLAKNITVIFTSMNAVEAVGKFVTKKNSWKIYCIGNTTKNLVEKYFGAENISATAEDAAQLAEKIIADKSATEVTFFCGNQRREELPEKLRSNYIDVEEIIVYRTIETPQIILRIYDGILFYSPSAVNSFFSKNTISIESQLFAIGSTTAVALKHFTQQPVIIAELPGKENLMHLAIDHFSKTKIP
jgi:uroporphyrinogen-III synthase